MFYAAMTWYLGFKPFFDEWKVMGMAGHGQPRYLNQMADVLKVDDRGYKVNLDYFNFHIRGPADWVSEKFLEKFGPARLANDLVTQDHFDIASSLQQLVEMAGVALARRARELTGESKLCLAGGVALNVLMNSRIVTEAGFDDVFIQPVAGDAGTSFGAASYYYHSQLRNPRGSVFDSPYLGSSYDSKDIEIALIAAGVHFEKCDHVSDLVARHIADGKIVGWFQGRMEAGPRALGNRSILADPRNPNAKELLNLRIKRRESFRPFAPSVCEEETHRYFEMPKGKLSPYMVLAGKTRESFRAQLPAVTHIDGTARVHSVSERTNPKFWNLLRAFERLTGLPILLNTSFNESEPIVESPQQAIECFKRTEMDILVIENFVVVKSAI
jgi:carbamoyltransferase